MRNGCVIYRVINGEIRPTSESLPSIMIDFKRKEIIMSISQNLARILQQYKDKNGLTFKELSDELAFSKSTLVEYFNGKGNPRLDNLELLSAALDIPLTEIVSAPLPGQEQAETVTRAAQIISNLDPERQKRALQLFLELAALFAEETQN